LLRINTEPFEISTENRSGYKYLHGHIVLALGDDEKVKYYPLPKRKQLALKMMAVVTGHKQGTVCFP
jgi:hypothetical protein